jgi:hypothetical protein
MARRPKKRLLKLPDLSDVETKGFVIPEGDYRIRVADIETGEGSSGTYFKWTFEIAEGQFEGKKPKPEYTSLAKESQWKLKSLLECLDIPIPAKAFELDYDDVIGKECMASIDHESYEGRIQSKISNFVPLTAEDDEDEEDEKPKKAKKSKPVDDDEDEDEDEKPKKSKKSKAPVDDDDEEDEDEKPKRGRKAKKPVDDDENEEEDEKPKRGRKSKKADDDDEDEEDEKPAPKKGKKAKKAKPTQAEIQAMSQDDLQDFVDENELDVDLSDYATIRKMRSAVIDAAIEAEVIDED